MAQIFSGSLSVTAGVKTYASVPINGIQRAGKRLQVDILMTGTAFPNGVTMITIGLSMNGGASYQEASGIYTAPFAPGKGGIIPDQKLGFLIGDTTLITHARIKTSAPSAFSLPVTITATEVA